ncbi:hypothetical protein A2W13_01505 [Candidatus Woesebacteria bacterium RBG_16_36_11]|uniref:Fibronectin type-III domain-containing protein n=3 Tax=Candidatus Woeseibacteriota TaxID=1752722 RepID=A0A1F7XBA7_9BACT|nr:MAG: hypothetical protein A2Z67_03515 [Candidatus Woesebacteria bacterium RBG_13_36_22]OGM12301.1 MAG: hypothetical protein A2W13_01505 [Candidatus Woesebacteria bacterium RBG_16_36_11]OGM16282.1 MAG: hypothetical protein A2V55_02610 [Candidatus Woesebacteria bacterium RBG_19FT_COMBO_37_29]
MNQRKVPTVIGILVLIIGLAVGIYLLQSRNIFKLGAKGETLPKDVRMTNITDSSFSVSWTTDKETGGFVSWGESEGRMDSVEEDELEENGFTHFVTIRGLSPTTTYYFKINSGANFYDNNGVPWQVTTGPVLNSITKANTISGTILTATGEPAANALIYVSVGGSSPLSTSASKDGSWVVMISSLRTNDLASFFTINQTKDVIEIAANLGPKGTSSAQIYLTSAKPVPPMVLGQTHNFKNSPSNKTDELPEANLELPQDATPTSKFTSDEKAIAEAKVVTIKSIDEGETVSSNKPEFFGEGPASTNITITVESDVISASVKVGANGSWVWSPPKNLTPGVHKITISWKDANGILKSITKTFIVQASEVPAFEATPSATPTSTPTPTPTTKPTSTPTPTSTVKSSPTATPKASLTPTPKATSTSSPLPGSPRPSPTPIQPVSGTGLPSIFLLILGVLLLTGGSVASYRLFLK